MKITINYSVKKLQDKHIDVYSTTPTRFILDKMNCDTIQTVEELRQEIFSDKEECLRIVK